MDINTRFGPMEIDPDSIITLPHGLAGFENLTRFKLFHELGKEKVFWMQSIDDPDIQFPVTNPELFSIAYEVELSDEDTSLLELNPSDDTAILLTLSDKGDDKIDIHANFNGPIIINTTRRLGMQKTLSQISGSVLVRAA